MVVFGVQIIFVVYMILVTLLLVNMLIAMMGHTYETVNESQKEWYRQVPAVFQIGIATYNTTWKLWHSSMRARKNNSNDFQSFLRCNTVTGCFGVILRMV